MTFDRHYRLSSHLLILTGLFSILITGSYPVAVGIGLTTTVLHGWMGERLPALLRIPRQAWNGIALALLTYLFYDSFFASQDLVGNGIRFVVYLQVVKLLSPKTHRDVLQIYLLSFLHLLASTVISSDLSFSVPFLIYIVLATWTLAMFTLQVQLERATPPDRGPEVLRTLLHSRTVITRGFLGLTSVLALLIIAFTLLVFFLFPRLSMGNFLKRIDLRRHVSGFSESVELGTIGNIKLNDAVVMRVELSPETLNGIDTERLYWRGTASDRFDGRRWTQTFESRVPVRVDTDTGILRVRRKTEPDGDLISYRVFLEALDPPLLFGADSLYRITWDKPLVERIFRGSIQLGEDEYGGLHFAGTRSFVSDLTYTAESVLSRDRPPPAADAERPAPAYIRAYYLQLPELDPDVLRLLRSIPLPAGPAYARARAIVDFLERNYRYTLEVNDIGVEDPLHFFLLKQKRGHCEYFSTALAIALRVHDIPAREVVGFRGGEINRYGGYVAVRQRDAHSWVEAYLPGPGWTRLDPSPLDSTVRTESARFRAVSQFVDFLRLHWNKYILEYDLRSQGQLAETLLHTVRGERKKDPADPESPRAPFRSPVRPKTFFFGLVILFLLWAFRTVLFRPRKSGADFGRLQPALDFLARHGRPRLLHETVREFRLRLNAELGELQSFTDLERMYYEERFGRRPSPGSGWNEALGRFRREARFKIRVKRAA